MAHVQNPVLPGFHPDPCMIYVNDVFYVATSTFEWFPGVRIYASRDLAHWTLAAQPLITPQQLPLMGVPDSGGVWAPCLSYADGVFYLVYTVVKNFGHAFFDLEIRMVTTSDMNAPWSEAVCISKGGGFDPSLFHDTDGRKWLVNMRCDYRPWNTRFCGITVQEYCVQRRQLVGEQIVIWQGSPRRTAEGPHLYRKDGYYYLVCAEGGTGWRHCATVLRSKTLCGPYEQSPFDPFITSWPYPQNALQKAGHASLVQAGDDWFLAHLCARPVGQNKDCILGRETAVQRVAWENNWPRLAHGDNEPLAQWESPFPDSDTQNSAACAWRDDFDTGACHPNLQSLRVPLAQRADLDSRKGFLRLTGAESLESLFCQSLLAARQQWLHQRVDTKLDFTPVHFLQTAGLVYYYDTASHYYACVTRDEQKGRVLTLMRRVLHQFDLPLGVGVPLPEEGSVWLRLETYGETAQFFYALDGRQYVPLGQPLDACVLSDDYHERHRGENRFTGAFVGICCQDGTGQDLYADFDFYACTPTACGTHTRGNDA